MKCHVCAGPCERQVIASNHTYYRCRSCFTSQLLPQPTADELAAFYNGFHQFGGAYAPFEDRVQADFPCKARLTRKFSRQGARLLDVGCGKGVFVGEATKLGFLAEGIDISESGVAYAVNTLGVRAKQGRIEDFESAGFSESFDVVTFWATVEHVSDPRSALAAIYRALKPGGILICDTGLGNAPWERFLAGHSQWFDAPQHLFVFSKQGLTALLLQAGFSIVSVDGNFERSVPRRVVKTLRHALICFLGFAFFRPLLGKAGFEKMREESKWPLGRLLLIVARKPA